jgi:hypothetical protein
MIRSPSGVSHFPYPKAGPKSGGKAEAKTRPEAAARDRNRAKAKSSS